ncbi:MAG: hypothetical protein EBR82_40115 [Caulobacteraceae bacterium]|nr:hypothetical protein [Caulobacteraceae bacterium]
MAIVNGYTDLNTVKNALGLGLTALSPDDQEIEAAIGAVSRTIDDYCGLSPTLDYRLDTNKDFIGWPSTGIIITTFGSHSFPVGITEGVKVIGTRGWAAIPAAVAQACLLQTVRIHSRRSVPFGVAGSPDGGIIRLLSRLDPDVELMLRPYRVAREAM